jgi:hypothetical protein
VWKFCVVDNPRDLSQMSVKEQQAQQLLRKARDGLNKSKINRLGGRVYTGELFLPSSLWDPLIQTLRM